MSIKIIMIEDDCELAQLLCDFLKKYDLVVENFDDPFLGISSLNLKDYDLLILDLSLPGLDGLEICKEVRQKSDIPIIISSARSDVDDKIKGLELGADDYLPKPYEPKELYARIMSVLRRYKKKTEYTLKLNKGLVYDEQNCKIYLNNKPLELTRAEFEVLLHMLKKEGCVISRSELIGSSQSLNEESASRSLDVLISRIRTKLAKNSKNKRFIYSIRGVGYRLEN